MFPASSIEPKSQILAANHQKYLVALYKPQTEAAQYTESVRGGRGVKLIGERIFEETILHMQIRVLGPAPRTRADWTIMTTFCCNHSQGMG